MNIKAFVKKYSPDTLLQCYRFVVRKYSTRKIIAKAERYRSYYQDELSRRILSDREEYLITGDADIFLRRAFTEGKSFSDYIFYVYGHSCFVWHSDAENTNEAKCSGAIILYDVESKKLERMKLFLAVCDPLNDYKLMTTNELFAGSVIESGELIINAIVDEDIFRQARKYIEDNNLGKYFVADMLWYDTANQYFDVLKAVEDAGAYDGMTALHFLKWGGDKIKRIYTFDFDPENIAKCKKNLKNYNNKIKLIEKGTWDKEEVMYLDSAFIGSGSSKVSDNGQIKVQLTTIDNVVGDEHVTFIKMDIEGAELKSLMGAKNTIIRNHPRLAISVYHKPEDISLIPEYILSLVPEYKFYLRHYSSFRTETILYAYCE